jgi:hypothetical protein
VGEEGKLNWCPFKTEFLPDFYFICGIMGHMDKECSIKLKKREDAQFGKRLKWVPPKRFYSEYQLNWNDGRNRSLIARAVMLASQGVMHELVEECSFVEE